MDFRGRRCTVVGKGNRQRTIYFGRNAGRALGRYLREGGRKDGDCAVFASRRSAAADQALSRYGLLRLVEKLGREAGLQAVRCSPHTFRHTFAIEFLRAGGNQFSLKELLGHSSPRMTNRYDAPAQADLEAQHRLYSPADRVLLPRGNLSA